MLTVSMIQEFYLVGVDSQLHHFVNPTYYFGHEAEDLGFFEVIEEGDWTLLRKAEIHIENPSTGLSATTGTISPSSIRRDRLYLFYAEQLIRIPKHKAKAIKALTPYIPNLESLVKQGNINFKQAQSLQVMVKDLNANIEDSTK